MSNYILIDYKENPKKNMLITQSNSLVEAKYSLSLYEQRLVLMMISLIEPSDKDFKEYSIKINDFRQLLGLKNKNLYSQIKKVIQGLMEKTLFIPLGGRDYLMSNWISDAEYRNSEGVIFLSFSKKLKPYLLAIKKNFTTQRLETAIQFKGAYTIRIYTLLKQYENIGCREFHIDKLRDILGIKKGKYAIYTDFKKRAINQAKSEFGKKNKDGVFLSDLTFDLETRRTGRKISHLKFIIKKQKTAPVKQLKIDIPPEENPHQNTPEYKAMLLLAISEKHALAFMEQYGAEYIAEKLQVLAERQQIEDVISPSGLFINALKEDRKSEKLAKQKKDQKRRAKEEEKRRLEQLERKKHDLIIQFGKIVKKEFFASLSKKEESQLLADLKTEYEAIDDFFKLDELRKNGLKSLILGADITKRIPNYAEKREKYIKANLKK